MTNTLLLISIGFMIFCGMALLGSLMLSRTGHAASVRVLQITTGKFEPTQPKEPLLATLQKVLFDAVRRGRTALGLNDDEKLIVRFARAGMKSAAARDTYFAARFLGPLLAVALCSFLPSHRFGWMMASGGVVYLAPDIILQRLIKRRTEKIRLSVPDALDLLVICVDAGLGLDQAMLRVGQELSHSHPQVYEEFMQINREQRAGKLRLDAWKAMAERCNLPEIDGFVDMLMQTERFGTPIARALSDYGDNIRQKRRQRAEELAAKTTVKIIFPLVLCIFPSLFIVLIGPAGISIMRALETTTL
jgi:tight adherence protein C